VNPNVGVPDVPQNPFGGPAGPNSNTFQQFTVNIGPVGGLSLSFSLSPTGQTFISIGGQLGKSPEFVAPAVTANHLFGMPNATSQQVSQALSGWSTTIGGGFILGGQATWNSWQWTPSSAGGGFFLPQFGVSVVFTFSGPTLPTPGGP
jgi:hypothetical protein